MRNEGVREGIPRVGHVTPSFRTDAEVELQSNIDLQVSLV